MRDPQTQHAEELAERFTAFYGHMYNPMRSLLARTAVGADQEAVLHDAFEVAWRHLLKTGNLDRRWFVQVVRNKVGDFYRAAARREHPVDGLAILEPGQPVDAADAWANRVDVQQAMLRLPVDTYEVLVLALWCDLPTAEAAAVLGISPTAFSTRLSRAKQAFAAQYAHRPASSEKQVPRQEVTEWTE
ncbi:MAG: sigma-70 family RNA polymerase sigma factor [Propionicimonas sp.]|nr:sigma-70 family RNA polymerase sigma factor [Propionicimonas sp.]